MYFPPCFQQLYKCYQKKQRTEKLTPLDEMELISQGWQKGMDIVVPGGFWQGGLYIVGYIAKWWFQTLFIFTPKIGEMIQMD